jgi:hypothetical protein
MKAGFAVLALALGTWGATPAVAGDVTYAARVDDEGQVFVDVENATSSPILVTTFVLRFFGAHERLLERAVSDCDAECSVAPGASEAFGPFEAPEDWQTVRVDDVFFEKAPVTRGVARPRNQLPPRTPAAPRESPLPAAPAAIPAAPPATPEAALRELYKWLVRGDYERARQLYTPSASQALAAGQNDVLFRAWAERETKNGTVVEVRLLEPASETLLSVRAEIAFADGSSARRRVRFRRDGDGWRVESIEEAR